MARILRVPISPSTALEGGKTRQPENPNPVAWWLLEAETLLEGAKQRENSLVLEDLLGALERLERIERVEKQEELLEGAESDPESVSALAEGATRLRRSCLNRLGELMMSLGEYGSAADYLEQARTLGRSALHRTESHPLDLEQDLETLGNIALLRHKCGEPAAALDLYAQLIGLQGGRGQYAGLVRSLLGSARVRLSGLSVHRAAGQNHAAARTFASRVLIASARPATVRPATNSSMQSR